MALVYKDIAEIDIVFLLLIFFIVASQVMDTKPRINILEAVVAAAPTA